MSKIGSYNLMLQEQANELGFETTQQALDAGCVVEGDCDQPRLVEPLELAHRAWEKEKEEALNAIDHLKGAIEYLYKGEELNPETAAVSLDGNINMPLRYSDVLKIKKFIEEAHE